MSFLIGILFVGIVQLLGHYQLATPVPFWLLLPGFTAGAMVAGPSFNLKEDGPWSVLSSLVVWAVNIALYSGLAHLALRIVRRSLSGGINGSQDKPPAARRL